MARNTFFSARLRALHQIPEGAPITISAATYSKEIGSRRYQFHWGAANRVTGSSMFDISMQQGWRYPDAHGQLTEWLRS
eukprot:scaffold479475_cov18-Prasinocladus_malaysianus.AAC.1